MYRIEKATGAGNIETLISISEYFGVSIEYLLYGEMGSIEQKISDLLKMRTEAEKEYGYRMLRSLYENLSVLCNG